MKNNHYFSFDVGLKLIVEGKSTSEWVEPAGKSNRTFRGEERYINYTSYLTGDKDLELLEIPVGFHTYTKPPLLRGGRSCSHKI